MHCIIESKHGGVENVHACDFTRSKLSVRVRKYLVCVCVCVCICPSVIAIAASPFIYTNNKRYSRVCLRLFLLADYRKNLLCKSHGVKKP